MPPDAAPNDDPVAEEAYRDRIARSHERGTEIEDLRDATDRLAERDAGGRRDAQI